MSMFLNKMEIIELTGIKQFEKQRKWLTERGYIYDISVDGRLVVLRAHIEKKLGGYLTKLTKSMPNEKALCSAMSK